MGKINMTDFKLPMRIVYLEQTSTVQMLLDCVIKLFDHIDDVGLKNELLNTLAAFYHERTPVTVSLINIMLDALDENIRLEIDEAAIVLERVVIELRDKVTAEVVKKQIHQYERERRPALIFKKVVG